jgi:hypothetical protein
MLMIESNWIEHEFTELIEEPRLSSRRRFPKMGG